MTLAFYFYGLNNDWDAKKIKKYDRIIGTIFITVLLTSIFTDYFVKDVIYSDSEGMYVESFGFLFFIIQILYILSPSMSLFLSLKKYKHLKWIKKKRFLYLSSWYHIFIFLFLIFLGILPIFNIWVLQKEQILFFIPYLFWLWYPLYRYRFWNITVWISKIIVFVCSVLLTIIWLTLGKNYLLSLGTNFNNFWWLSSTSMYFEYAFWFTIFYLIYRFLLVQFLSSSEDTELQFNINKIKAEIPRISNITKLNNFLNKEFPANLKISWAKVIEITENDKYLELQKFFWGAKDSDFFLNDSIFIEENSQHFSKPKIQEELHQKISLYLPLRKSDGALIGFLGVGFKYLREFYISDEIEILIDFSHFIAWHFRYLNTFKQVQELNFTLDKRIDEKTIEYNNLISRQKEFIAYLGHEVKNPITNILFLGKEIEDEINGLETSKKKKSIQWDIWMLNNELIKIADLTRSIFSTEKMDLWKIKLYKSHINIYNFLHNELLVMQKTFQKVHFQLDGNDIWKIEIDEIQFREVIHNLLTNASKYVNAEKWKVLVALEEKHGNIKITIEDNGEWLSEADIENIFEKYATWNNDSIWLGMWLYLCKRIVELHWWKISASNSEKLGWANFTIKL